MNEDALKLRRSKSGTENHYSKWNITKNYHSDLINYYFLANLGSIINSVCSYGITDTDEHRDYLVFEKEEFPQITDLFWAVAIPLCYCFPFHRIGVHVPTNVLGFHITYHTSIVWP